MKKSYLLILFLLSISFSFGQKNAGLRLEGGTKAPDFTLNDINGNSHHLYEYLEAGKTVILDFSAVWCNPCWNYHKSGILEKLYKERGPKGTDDFMVFMIESDGNSTLDQLKGVGGGNNWVEGTEYPIILTNKKQGTLKVVDDYKIELFPTIIMVCPEKEYKIVKRFTTVADYVDASGDCSTVNRPPKVGFDFKTNCLAGSQATFNNYSKRADSYEWTMPGATPASSTEAAPIFTYASAGEYSATLKIKNSLGEQSLTKKIKIYDPKTIDLYKCDFENSEDFSQNIIGWTTVDGDKEVFASVLGVTTPDDKIAFEVINPKTMTPPVTYNSFQPHSGNKFGVSMSSGNKLNDDWLISSKLPLGEKAKFIFWSKAYNNLFGKAQYEVCVSTTTNEPSAFKVISGNELITAEDSGWAKKEFDLSAYANKSVYVAIHAKFKSMLNALMIDDIKVESNVGIKDVNLDKYIGIYPNPAKDNLYIDSDVNISEVVLYNNLGQRVYYNANPTKEMTISTSDFIPGLYILQLTGNKGSIVKKIQINK